MSNPMRTVEMDSLEWQSLCDLIEAFAHGVADGHDADAILAFADDIFRQARLDKP